MNTYTKFASALSGHQEDRFSSEAVWDEVLYYNFVQQPLTGCLLYTSLVIIIPIVEHTLSHRSRSVLFAVLMLTIAIVSIRPRLK